MKNILLLVNSVLLMAIAAVACSGVKKHKEEKVLPVTTGGFAVVELFTSEGCSSCPAADEVLETISKEKKENVFLLGFHVDYWNRLGWKDEFSNAEYTSRQQQYAQVFQRDGVYTPQAIVNGTEQFVGSDEDKLNSEIRKQLSLAANVIPVINSVKLNSNSIEVNFTTKEDNNVVVNIALVQLHAITGVKRGENEGRKLSHVNIVRDFKNVDANNTTQSVSLTLPAGLTAVDCKVIVYTQGKSTLKITGAASAAIQ